MQSYEKILKTENSDLEKLWFEYYSNCEKTQNEILQYIIDLYKDTEYGKLHNFKGIKTVEDYRSNVPLNDYSEFESYIERMGKGEENLLFQGNADYFILTSGTTSKKSKLIPENENAKMCKNAIFKLRNYYVLKNFLTQFKQNPHFLKFMKSKLGDKFTKDFKIDSSLVNYIHFLTFSISHDDLKTEAGIPLGFASGMSFKNTPLGKAVSFPPRLMSEMDIEISNYLINLFSLRYDDIVYLTTNNAASFVNKVEYAQEHAEELINDLENGTIKSSLDLSKEDREYYEGVIAPLPERAHELREILERGRENFIPKNYWPNIFVSKFWLGGSVGFNVDDAKRLLPDDTIYFDVGYGSSEAKINIPYTMDTPCGTLATFSGFYEFIPIDNPDEILSAWELEDGCEYDLILTNMAGLYRYHLHDIVKVCGFNGDTPNLYFINKSSEVLNIGQEKIPASEFVKVLSDNSGLNF